MRKLGEQWAEELDGDMHMYKCIGLNDDMSEIIKDLGVLNEDGCLPCPFCEEYPESFNKGNEYTKKRGSALKCNKCHYELTVCAIYQTIEWCKEKVLYNWNRRA